MGEEKKPKALGKGLKGMMDKPRPAPNNKELPQKKEEKPPAEDPPVAEEKPKPTKDDIERLMHEVETILRAVKSAGVDTTEEEVLFLQARTVTVMGNLEQADEYLSKIAASLEPKLPEEKPAEPEEAAEPEPEKPTEPEKPAEPEPEKLAPEPEATHPPDPEPTSEPAAEGSEEEEMMFCLFCGKKIPATSIFCNFCGQKVVE